MLLDIKQLTVRFGGLIAVNSVDFSVKPGEIYSVIGPNGAGKTTVFNAITGIYDPSAGEIVFEGLRTERPATWSLTWRFTAIGAATGIAALLAVNLQSLWEAAISANYIYKQVFPWGKAFKDAISFFASTPAQWTLIPFVLGAAIGGFGARSVWQQARRRPDFVSLMGLARTFQNIRLFQDMTVLENVLVGMDRMLKTRLVHGALRLPLYWRERAVSEREARELLQFVELEAYSDETASTLSYGHQRRLEIARALATRPKLLLLDEPAAGMNPAESLELVELIRKIREKGISVLLIEHHMKVVMGISDRITVLDFGNKIAEGTPEEIKCDPKVIEAYLGPCVQ